MDAFFTVLDNAHTKVEDDGRAGFEVVVLNHFTVPVDHRLGASLTETFEVRES